LQDKGVLIAR